MSEEWPKQDVPRMRKLFGAEIDDLDEMEDERLLEAVGDHVQDNGERVFRFDWDSGGPGAGAGADWIHVWRDIYFVSSTEIYGAAGPFDTLDEAVLRIGFTYPDGRIDVNGATTSIQCERWTDDKLLRRIKVDPNSPPKTVLINGTEWAGEDIATESERLARLHTESDQVES